MHFAGLRDEYHARQKRPGSAVHVELHAAAFADRDLHAYVAMEDGSGAHGVSAIHAQHWYAMHADVRKVHDLPTRRIDVFTPCVRDGFHDWKSRGGFMF